MNANQKEQFVNSLKAYRQQIINEEGNYGSIIRTVLNQVNDIYLTLDEGEVSFTFKPSGEAYIKIAKWIPQIDDHKMDALVAISETIGMLKA